MQWISLSEVVVGKAIVGSISPSIVDAEKCHPSYAPLIVALQEGKNESDLVDAYGFAPVHACRQAAASVNGSPLDYVGLLEKSALRSSIGRTLLPIAKKLEQGEDADIAQALASLAGFEIGRSDFVRLSDVTPEAAVWSLSSYPPLDQHVGGFPKAGLTIIAGPPGTGKTSLLARVLTGMAIAGRETAFFSLEMTTAQVLMRMLEVEPGLTMEQRSCIHAAESAYTPEEIYAAASRIVAANPKIELIGIDMADLMIEGEEKTAKASAVYRSMALLAKRLEKPIVLLAQLNRETYTGGIPKIHHIRWSGMAEALASLVLLVYNPERIYANNAMGMKGNPLPYYENSAYLIVGKSRFGFRENQTGAILVDWKGAEGWGTTSRGYFALGVT